MSPDRRFTKDSRPLQDPRQSGREGGERMPDSKSVRILFLEGEEGGAWCSLKNYLGDTRTLRLESRPISRIPEDFKAYQVILLAKPERLSKEEQEQLSAHVREGGSCAGFAAPSSSSLPPLFGVQC